MEIASEAPVQPPVHRHAFSAMASPCEVQVECADAELAQSLGRTAEAEARRIEAKYSRYLSESVVSRINTANGKAVLVDEETAGLLDYAQNCHALSQGRFDITSGALRRAWKFDGSDRVPTRDQVNAILPVVGWAKVRWENREITLPPGMEIDLGGVCKEYAVDRAAMAMMQVADLPMLVNFGGDLRITRPRAGGRKWRISIEAVDKTAGSNGGSSGLLEIASGALATSGDARRFLLKDGVRYSHILDPKTGFPIENPPRSITVAARSCMEAGTLSTLAMLQGSQAQQFLDRENVQSWVIW